MLMHMMAHVKTLIHYNNTLHEETTRKVISIYIDLFTDSDAILKIIYVDFSGKVAENSDSSSKIV